MSNGSRHPRQNSEPRQRGPGQQPPKYKRSPVNILLIVLVVFGAIMLLSRATSRSEISWSQLETYLKNDQVKSLEIGDTRIEGKLRANLPDPELESKPFTVKFNPDVFRDRLNKLTEGKDIEIRFQTQDVIFKI